MSTTQVDALNDLLRLIYGKDVVEDAYASPAGRLTKTQAKTKLSALNYKQELEARLDELQRLFDGYDVGKREAELKKELEKQREA